MRRHRLASIGGLALVLAACGGGGGGGGGGGESGPIVFTLVAEAGVNTDGNYAFIDHPRLNGNPDAVVLVTHVVDPGGGPAVDDACHIGVFYDDASGRWAVFNQSGLGMPDGAAFHVLIPPVGPEAFTVVAGSGNTTTYITQLASAVLDGNPGATLLVTQNWNPGGGSGVYNDHAIGVYYPGGGWAVFNEDHADVPLGAGFNVYVAPAGEMALHTSTIANTYGLFTTIDDAALDGDPFAMPLITQSYEPMFVYNTATLSVAYNVALAKWVIMNSDGSSIPIGASFFYRR